jgi:DNA-3-methyladenine glycosylase I
MGDITVYSHLQACGIINDHDKNCPRYRYINTHFPTVCKRRDAEKGVQHF